GLDLQLRIAVNPGEALVSLRSRPELGESMIAGDVINTAARLQSAAPVNGILVGEETHAATHDAIVYEPAPPVVAKGKAEPLTVWVAVRAALPAGERRLSVVPLVGRGRQPPLDRARARPGAVRPRPGDTLLLDSRFPRGGRSGTADTARLRGPALGRSEPARPRRDAGRAPARRSDPRARPRAARASRRTPGLGRRHAVVHRASAPAALGGGGARARRPAAPGARR